MADNAAGKGQQTTQHPTIEMSIGGEMTLAKAAVMVTAEARARAWWRRQRRPSTEAGEVVVGAFDGGGSVVAFDGGNGLWRGNDKREIAFDCGGGGR